MNGPPPVRVLHVLAHDALAGTELMVASVVLGSNARVHHELATLGPAGPIAARIGPGSGRVMSLGSGGGPVRAAWRLGRLLRARPYDVINAYGLKASVAARLVARAARPGAAFVFGVRGRHVADVERPDSPKARVAVLVERVLSPLVDVYDANSRGALELLAGLGIDDERLVHIPNGLDLSLWAPPERRHDDPVEPIILCVGRFVEYKRQEDLLRALAMLRADGLRFRAILAGDGPSLAAMRELASRLGLDEIVELPGAVAHEEVRNLLSGAAIACLPSAGEGMPGSLMEAMASEVPVVGTDVDGTSELVVDGQSGLLVPAYDPPALARALARLLGDPDLRDRLGRGGRRRMEERFSLDAMLEAKQRLYVELAARAPASQA